jgi:steroid delta-isomerase-like uncharacterized protein
MTRTDAKALVAAHYDAMINDFDPDRVRSQISEDFVDHHSGRAMSVDECIAHASALHASFAELRVFVHEMIAEDDRVAVRATWSGLHTGAFRGLAPTGRRVVFSGMVFWRVHDGRITGRWAEIDFGGLIAQRTAMSRAA